MKSVVVRGVEISGEESERLHLDWWGKCWTCRHWTGDMSGTGDVRVHAVLREDPCANPSSPLYNMTTSTGGYCKKWDSWDIETALKVLGDG